VESRGNYSVDMQDCGTWRWLKVSGTNNSLHGSGTKGGDCNVLTGRKFAGMQACHQLILRG
jgi:hypothetical protein